MHMFGVIISQAPRPWLTPRMWPSWQHHRSVARKLLRSIQALQLSPISSPLYAAIHLPLLHPRDA